MEDAELAALRVRAIVGGAPLFLILFLCLVATSSTPVRVVPTVLVVLGLAGLAGVVGLQHVLRGPFRRGPAYWWGATGAVVVAGVLIPALGPGPSTAFSVSQSFIVMAAVVFAFNGSVQVVAGTGHALTWLVCSWAFNDPSTDALLTGVTFQAGALFVAFLASRFFVGHVVVATEANETARRARAEAELARVQERRRLAEALHDHALRYVMDALEELGDAPRDDKPVRAAEDQLAQALRALRALTLNMQEDQLAEMDPRVALEFVVAEAVGDGRLDVELHITGEIDWRHTVLLVEAAREMLTNVRRHAEASRADVVVHVDDGHVRLSVEDDGRGVDDAAETTGLASGGVGVWRLRRHAEVLGGRFSLTARHQGGTVAVLEFRDRPVSGAPLGSTPR